MNKIYKRADVERIAAAGFTELEQRFLVAFIELLYAEIHFSDQDVKDVAGNMGVPIATAKGVLGSLCKKGVVSTQDSGTGYDLIYLNEEHFGLHKVWREEV